MTAISYGGDKEEISCRQSQWQQDNLEEVSGLEGKLSGGDGKTVRGSDSNNSCSRKEGVDDSHHYVYGYGYDHNC